MKKYLAPLCIFALFYCCSFTSADENYNLEIDANNNEVYLITGDTQITLENINDYLTGLDADLNLGLINTGDFRLVDFSYFEMGW